MSEDLESKIIKWLAGEGYPLEMRVARSFIQAKWETAQSAVYHQDGKYREIDVVAMHRVGLEQASDEIWRAFEFAVVVECKSSTSKPWIVFSTEASAGPALFNVESRAGNKYGRRFLRLLAEANPFEPHPFFVVGERTGYAAVRAFESGNQDGAYAAIAAVIDATSNWCKFAANAHTARCRIVFPVVVTAAPLFECFLDSTNNETIVKRDSITLYADSGILGGQYAVIEIVSEAALPAYVAKLEELHGDLWDEHQELIAASFGDLALTKV